MRIPSKKTIVVRVKLAYICFALIFAPESRKQSSLVLFFSSSKNEHAYLNCAPKMLPWQLRGAVRIQAVEMAKEGRSSSKRSLSRPKKRKYYGKPRSGPRDDPVEHEDVEESLENSECGSSSASKLRTLPSLRTPCNCTPVDVYDQSSTSASAASRDSSSCSETECSEGEDDDDDDDDEVDSDSSTWSDDDGCDSELSGNRVVNMSSRRACRSSSLKVVLALGAVDVWCSMKDPDGVSPLS